VVEDLVTVVLLVERELVLEARAATALDRHAQPSLGLLLRGEELAYLLGRNVGESDHLYSSLAASGAAIVFIAMPTAEQLRERIEGALPGSTASVEDLTGTGDHFRAEVVSERFEGLSRIEQHQLVYSIFGTEIGGPIHALSIKTSTPGSSSA